MTTWDNSALPRTRKEAKALGIPRFFLNKPCPHGHNDARYTANGKCVVCMLKDIRSYQSRHREKENARCRQWAKDNPDKNRALTERWAKANPDKTIVSRINVKAKQRGATGRISVDEWVNLRESFNNRCVACGRDDKPIGADHVIPIARGGENHIDNIQPLCFDCNRKKNVQVIDYRDQVAS